MAFKPGLWPKEIPRPSESRAELRVWEALEHGLPEGWSAWHSLRIRSADGFLGEGDFVIACPTRGVLVLEVKGGRIEQRDGRWFQNGAALEKAPLDQGQRFARMLKERLLDLGVQAPAFGVAVCFPDTAFDEAPSQDDLRGIVIGANALPWLKEALEQLMSSAQPAPRAGRGHWEEALHRIWGETWIPHVSLGSRVKTSVDRAYRLDDRQVMALDLLFENERVLVNGPAGSGKTLLAAECARRCRRQGKKTLLLCFTRALATWLKAELGADGIEVRTVSALAKGLTGADQASLGPSPSSETWKDLSLRAADVSPEEPWEAIVLDEAQDLQEEDWLLVESLAAGRRLWAFQDDRQRFWPDRQTPTKMFATTVSLQKSYRSPSGVLALARRYLGEPTDAQLIREAMGSKELALIAAPTESAVVDRISVAIDQLRSEGLEPRDIAVLSLRGRSAEGSIIHRQHIGRHRAVPADHPEMAESIVVDTFLRFKGLERPAVVVTDLGLVEPETRNMRMYIALTRTLSLARIVAPRTELLEDEILRPFA